MGKNELSTSNPYRDISAELDQQIRRDTAKALEAEIFKQFEKPSPEAASYTKTDFEDAVNQLMKNANVGIPQDYIVPGTMMGKGSVLSNAIGQDTEQFLKKNNVDELKRLINQTDNQIIIKMLAHKLGRQFSYDKDAKRVIEYMSRLSMPYYKETKPEGLSDDNLSMLEYHLKQIPGVSVQVIFEYYPDEASIIVRVDHRSLTDDELESVPSRIQDTIKEYKPKGLKELEVIYHNKEVY
ncbi:hypothetical protein 0305phi8-36p006 [Bacillus phage 0305phi8-36]|uniref:hypothetical protein n=1 Tax=Bacillus phage 0305phi8-36 TaxID=458639 RepID=UPI00015A1F63|nr:hypothetical protein ST0305phi8-36p006 [Bacillus phage 0305phi8-36]ABS83571.1 hypothetical protein 0305phi8-36p006 [Bacillus phage 0305phi8-36]